jgi:hypothetical protein
MSVYILERNNIDQPRSNSSKHIRVLLADPDEFLHSEYREPLSWKGFALVMALNGLECISRLRDLRVDNVDGRVVVRGRSDSHHVKQLALTAVLEAFEASQSQSERVELEIEVGPIDGWQERRCALSETRNFNYADQNQFTKD